MTSLYVCDNCYSTVAPSIPKGTFIRGGEKCCRICGHVLALRNLSVTEESTMRSKHVKRMSVVLLADPMLWLVVLAAIFGLFALRY